MFDFLQPGKRHWMLLYWLNIFISNVSRNFFKNCLHRFFLNYLCIYRWWLAGQSFGDQGEVLLLAVRDGCAWKLFLLWSRIALCTERWDWEKQTIHGNNWSFSTNSSGSWIEGAIPSLPTVKKSLTTKDSQTDFMLTLRYKVSGSAADSNLMWLYHTCS